MTTHSDEADDNLDDANSISQVGKKTNNAIPTWGIVTFVVVAIVAIVLSSYTEEELEEGVSFTEEEFKSGNSAGVSLPRPATPIPAYIPEPINIEAITESVSELTPDQVQDRRNAEELRRRRIEAPLVLVNKARSENSNSLSSGFSGGSASSIRAAANDRIARLESSTNSALNKLTAPDNSSKGGLGNLSTASTELVDAEYIDDRSFKILEGKFIPAVLETAISSDLPGKIRAEVSENVYSNDGRLLLIPKGSLAKGEYRSGISQGQSRIFAIWTRVDTPHGMKIKLDSPSTDTLGRAGIGGIVDSHFLQRFGASAFLSIINGAAQQQSNNDNQREAFSESFSDASGIALENSINIPPTIHVLQGERINIFVAKDLNFKKAIELIQRRHKF